MLGLMQDWPLLIHKVIDYAALQFGKQEVVSRSVEGPIRRTTYANIRTRALQMAQRLERDGIRLGDRVATLAWNTDRHLEAWYGISGIGAVYHTVNPRLFPDQIAWIINHAEDRLVLTDLTFVPLIEALAERLPTVERYVIFTDDAHLPPTRLKNAVAYETWIAEADGDFRWCEFDERTAAGMCYTSGTTGNPKGVLYSHRSNVLHSMGVAGPDMFALSSRDVSLPVVPMFHANSWSLAFSCPMMGTKMVMPGPKLDGASIYELLETEAVTCAAAVPTIWLMLLHYLETEGKKPSTLKRACIGGSACPRLLIEKFEKNYGVRVAHAWGMTEMSPVGTVGSVKPTLGPLGDEALYDLKQKQGYAFFGVEMKITDDAGRPLPWDGKAFGRLKVRGCAVASTYYRDERQSILDEDGYFDTGDVATIDPDGYLQITDRAKDVIKSGGEWISSIEIENLAVGHADVAEAAVIGVAHPKWDERPLLIVVPKDGRTVDGRAVLQFLDGKIARWWMPNDVQIVSEIPHTATGKINKLKLRETFRDYRFPP
ncbi:MAG: long-chain-fatty-acid--CoA ligase [Methylobacteriaceae bacterium]|nr:long-chain-fatty-acid--CoA ligase [Methylobacteriaceae bacterium]